MTMLHNRWNKGFHLFVSIQNRNALRIFLNLRRFHDTLGPHTDDRVQRFPALANLATYKLNW